jgi:hypothetical protein
MKITLETGTFNSRFQLIEMKIKLIVHTSIIFLLPIVSNAQDVSANELVTKFACKTFDCFDPFITSKGFCLRTKQTHSGGDVELFYDFVNDTKLTTGIDNRFNVKDNAVMTSRNSTRIIFVTNSSAINVVTTNKAYCDTLLNQFKQLGFGDPDLIPGHYYSSPSYPNIDLWILTNFADKKTGLTNYQIILQDKKLAHH